MNNLPGAAAAQAANHVARASAAGAERLKQGPTAAGWTADETALLQFADDLYENSGVSDATWEKLAKKYSTEQLMDAVFTVGQYNMVSWALNTFGVPLVDDFLPGAKR